MIAELGTMVWGGGGVCTWWCVSPCISLPKQIQHRDHFSETLPSLSWQGEFPKGQQAKEAVLLTED